ncbi:hypothetical protein [Paenibacillus jilunlii]|uniref:Copper amine oxidase N-terminal domain-containing protein n=1 Tax=Paenibacillus jilunlii TaxID=682956 RepID=A0A1G9GQT3_9BACL|nr:hypothetical protein [Paenibacillus jilunlii]KWX73879.1 hypothetical protein AML91_16625 [Paenibacillus jilunlii]SDL03037.1 hypothetical protein SAMN05216191_101525 [Paenibacillus jilunlii]
MKKFISGFVVGALLFGGVSAFAASSLIGQKVQGLFTIEKGGTKVAEAVIINGSAYAPVRAVAEATGASLTVEGKKIIMSSENEKVPTAASNTKTLAELQAERNKIAEQVEKKTAIVSEFKKTQVDNWDVLISENPNSTTIPQWENTKKESEKMLEQLKTELATLQQQLNDLDAQIAALKH